VSRDAISNADELVRVCAPDTGAFVAGRWVETSATFDVDDPSTGKVIATVSDCTVTEGAAAVAAASEAANDWARRSPDHRAAILRRTHDLMIEQTGQLAELIARENGKSGADAIAEVAYAAAFFRWYAEEAVRVRGEYSIAPHGTSRTLVNHAPVGVAALITPWNFPAAMPARKIAPALAAGCTVVLKPAAETPLTTLAMARLLADAGLPPGVVNVVPTQDAAGLVGAWLDDPAVRKLSFTGSTPVGRQLLKSASARVLNCSMELGGAAPFVVLPDADIDLAVQNAMTAKFRGGGQACTAANSIHVHASVADAFTTRLIARVAELRVGPSSDGSDIGPLISPRAVRRLTAQVATAVSEGAEVVHRHELGEMPGHFFPPTVLAGVAPDSVVAAEELFGPVAPVLTFDDPDELIERLNASEYGLAAYVQAGDVGAGLRVADRLQAGMVAVNRGLLSDPAAPFGGMKQSGLGREGAQHGLLEFTETKYVSLDWAH
jgi:succinate-semialdehyde dehydrogenase/glutarate-semialdehyde dehydrogenase